MLRFLHLGDLHLDSPFAAFEPYEAAARRDRQYEALEQFLRAGVDRGAQLVLIAGDSFDTPAPRPEAVARFFGILEALPVPVVIAPGNHDYYMPSGVWDSPCRPANVAVFTDGELSVLRFPELQTAVYGYAFLHEGADTPDIGHGETLDPAFTNLLLAHADVTSPLSAYAPISKGQLEQSGYTYAALGHIHKPQPVKKYGATTVAYSGFFAGRGFDEPGEGGGRFVEIEGETVREIALKSMADTFEIRTLDCTGAQNGEEIRRKVIAFLEQASFPPHTALRLLLEGDVGLNCQTDPAQLSRAGERLALFEVVDRTLPLYDASYLEKAPTMQGAFYRELLPQLQSADEQERELAAAALRLGLAALAGREV